MAVSVDSATCDDCLSEVDDPHDRRYGYPFTNCTNCGPRYTIVLSVPYDRPATTMAGFKMCAQCQAEYDDPADRRFHAQPNACASCGPRIAFYDPDGPLVAGSGCRPRRGRRSALRRPDRRHKGHRRLSPGVRRDQPRRGGRAPAPQVAGRQTFCPHGGRLGDGAVFVRARSGRLVRAQQRRAAHRARPRAGRDARSQTASRRDLRDLGLMLPYTPLHHLLMAKVARPLVMSSGNQSDDPIAHSDDDAFARLGPMVDAVLAHDRRIHIRCDDSVVRATGRRLQMVRRSRGYAPEALPLPGRAARQVLAVGAELKNTVSVAKESLVVCSHHIGDLEHLATYQAFVQATVHLCRLFGIEPEVVAHDLHPEYLSTKYALDLDIEPWPVQHHHAHIASCLAEHGHTGTVLGIAFDGLGYGTDGTMWGGEFLVADFNGFERVGHLRPVAMPGGAAAVREPWRMALAWTARAARHRRGRPPRRGTRPAVAPGPRLWLAEGEGHGSVLTSSVGRLFDAVAALVGLRSQVTYEGQAAIELEVLARSSTPGVGSQLPGRDLAEPPAPRASTCSIRHLSSRTVVREVEKGPTARRSPPASTKGSGAPLPPSGRAWPAGTASTPSH